MSIRLEHASIRQFPQEMIIFWAQTVASRAEHADIWCRMARTRFLWRTDAVGSGAVVPPCLPSASLYACCDVRESSMQSVFAQQINCNKRFSTQLVPGSIQRPAAQERKHREKPENNCRGKWRFIVNIHGNRNLYTIHLHKDSWFGLPHKIGEFYLLLGGMQIYGPDMVWRNHAVSCLSGCFPSCSLREDVGGQNNIDLIVYVLRANYIPVHSTNPSASSPWG